MGGIPNALLVILFLGIHSVSSSSILQRQKRNWIIDSFKIEEERPYPYHLGTIQVEKEFLTLALHGQGVDKEPINVLSMNSTGSITVIGRLDYETANEKKLLKLSFEAFDSKKNVMDTKLGVEVAILDINDNAPTFGKETYEVDIKESESQGTFLTSVQARDLDNSDTKNGTFTFTIVSVSPKPVGLEFYIKQSGVSGSIEFNGCLDHEKAEKYTILVEAKDHGEKVQLSSTCTVIVNIEDGNNHMPVFTGQTGPASVKEETVNVTVLRLQVSDKDVKGTAAWKAKYTILDEKDSDFRIETDPETNEGVLYVQKKLDYEQIAMKNILVSVENEAPYYSCTVKSRPTSGRWEVVPTGGMSGTGLAPPKPNVRQVMVNVLDVNEPHVFDPPVKDVTLNENVAVGHYLEKFKATDPDGSTEDDFEYIKGEDRGDWVNVDRKSCAITTNKILDRESPLVKNDIYRVTVYAVDKATPPLTSTGTLNIHLQDQNDNLPNLTVNFMDICLSDGPSLANLTAFDLDKDPYGGPFHFKLLGDVMGKWRLDSDHGYTVNLIKESIVHAGHHKLQVKVSDLQGEFAVHNISITVCKCDPTTGQVNCHVERRASASKMGGGAIGILFIAMLLLLGILLLVFLLSCKSEKNFIPETGSGEEHLIQFNTETPGTDCKVPVQSMNTLGSQPAQSIQKTYTTATKSIGRSKSLRFPPNTEYFQRGSRGGWNQQGGSLHWSMRKSNPDYSMYQHWSRTGGHYDQRNSISRISRINSSWGDEAHVLSSEQLYDILGQRIYTLQDPERELGDYAAHQYVEEGDPETNSQLDAISIPEIPFDTDMLQYLGPRFNTLASISRPDADIS